MPTSGSYVPPQATCPEQIFTRADLIALRNAGGLRVNCHYRSVGPVIGTPGNTSPTVIEQHAVSAGELSTSAHVDSAFSGASAWPGIYNIDLGAAGTIVKLTDDWNNEVTDSDVDAPTVHSEFPWHARGVNLRENRVDDCTLTDWEAAAAAGFVIRDNDLMHAGIHFTGVTSGSFTRNEVQGPQVTISTPSATFNSNTIHNAPVTALGTGSLAFQGNTVTSGHVQIAASTTGTVTLNENTVGGLGTIGYRVNITGATGVVDVSGNTLLNQGPHLSYDLLIGGPGSVTVTRSQVNGGTVEINGTAGDTLIDGCAMDAPAHQKLGSGDYTIRDSNTTDGAFVQDAASAADFDYSSNIHASPIVNLSSGSGGSVTFGVGSTGSVFLNHQGTGDVQVTSFKGDLVMSTGAGSTRSIQVTSSTGRAFISQTGTGPAALDVVDGTLFQNSTVSFASSTGPGSTVGGVVTGQSSVNVTDADAAGMTATTVAGGSTLNLTAGGSVARCRFDAGVTVSTGSFAHTDSIAEGAFVLAPTTGNVNRLRNASFNDWT